MDLTGGDILVETLIRWGVTTVFGIPGDGINGVFEALRTRKDKIRFIQTRHEEAAAFMACGYAKFTGKLGVCITTSGPGGIHLLNGLYDAKMDGQPVLAITGMHFHDLLSTHAQQDVELDKLFMDVAVYSARVMGPDHVENVTDLACRKAIAMKAVAHVSIPVDFQSQTITRKTSSERNVPNHLSYVRAHYSTAPADIDILNAAEVLNAGKKIAILAGRGALDCTDELIQLAETLGAPIIKALLGKACVPDDSPYTTGGIGLLGTAPSQHAIEHCDTLLMVGTSFPYLEFYPKPGAARAIQIDNDPTRIGLRYPVEIGLAGDAKQTLRGLIPLLKQQADRGFLEEAQSGMREWNLLMKSRATNETMPMKPQVIASELGKRLPANAIVCCDSGTITTWWARHIPVKRGQQHTVSGTLASMACSLPYAIAAAIAFPERPVFCFIGDGGMAMLLGELATVVKYRLNIKIVVVKNDSLGQIKWEQMVFLGNPEYGCELEPIDFAAVARGFHMAGFTIADPKLCGAELEVALAAPGPCLIEAIVDPLEPPMPAKITPTQALHFAESLIKGEPNRQQIAMTVLADRVRELV